MQVKYYQESKEKVYKTVNAQTTVLHMLRVKNPLNLLINATSFYYYIIYPCQIQPHCDIWISHVKFQHRLDSKQNTLSPWSSAHMQLFKSNHVKPLAFWWLSPVLQIFLKNAWLLRNCFPPHLITSVPQPHFRFAKSTLTAMMAWRSLVQSVNKQLFNVAK